METGRKSCEIHPLHPEFETNSSDLRIVLLGKTGVEKSSLGNMILGREAFQENSGVSEIQRGRVEDRNISVIDTPGFFNPQLTDEDLQNEMMKSLSLSHPGPHVFLLIVRPDTFEECYVDMIVQKTRENFGAQVLKFTIVLFIRENMKNREWMVLTLRKKFQDLIAHFRGRHHVINTESETIGQITGLLEKIDQVVKQNQNQHFNNNINPKTPTLKNDKVKEINWKEKESEVETLRDTFKKMGEKEETVSTEDVQKLKESWKSSETEADLRIVMVGKSGAGKSATGNTILGSRKFKEEISSKSVTKECQTNQGKVEDKKISVTDTPGLFDTSFTNEEQKDEIERCIEMSVPGPHVFLLVLRVDVRFTDEEKDTMKWIQENFSDDAMNYAILLFTRGDPLDRPIDEFLEDNKQLKDLVDKCKGGYHVLNNKDRSQRQVTELLKKINTLVEKNGGQHYTNDMYQEAQRKIIEEQERKREEEEKKIKEEEENIRQEERDKVKDKVKKVALGVGMGMGAAGAIVGTVALAATPAVIIPALLIAGGAAISGGSGGTLVIDKIKSTIMQRKKPENTTTPAAAETNNYNN